MNRCGDRAVDKSNTESLNDICKKEQQISSSPATGPKYHQMYLTKPPRRFTGPQGQIKSNTDQSKQPSLIIVSKGLEIRFTGIPETRDIAQIV